MFLLYGLITVGYALAFAIGATKIGRIYSWNTFFAVGMALFVIGLLVRIHSILTLRQYFTYSVAEVENQKIIETGLYKFIRHPGYLGQLIIFIGIAISISNWLSILLMIIPVTLGYLYRIKVEEKFMSDQLGEEYKRYQEENHPHGLLMFPGPNKVVPSAAFKSFAHGNDLMKTSILKRSFSLHNVLSDKVLSAEILAQKKHKMPD